MDWELVLSAFVKCCTTDYSISILSIALRFLVKLLLKFIAKVNLINLVESFFCCCSAHSY